MITIRSNTTRQVVALLTLAEYCALTPSAIIALIGGAK